MTGLVGHWPLHEWSGSATDLSGNDNDGTVNGATQGVYGVGGLTGYRFDGSSDVDTGVSSISLPLTICGWVRLDSLSSKNALLTNYNSTSDDAWVQTNSSNEWEFGGDNVDTISTGTSASTYQWVHVAVTGTSSSNEIYINGSSKATGSGISSSPIDNGNNFQIGRGNGGGSPLDGYVAGVRIYDRVLSQSEIEALYQLGSGDYTEQSLTDGSDSGAVARYEFTSGSVTTDSWGSNTLTDNTSAGTTANAIRGDAKSFDGSDDYMDLTGVLPTLSGSYCISFWMNQTGTSVNDGNLDDPLDFKDNNEIQAEENGGTINFFHWTSGGSVSVSTGSVGDSWIHYTIVWDGSLFTLYENGVKVDSVTATDYNPTNSDAGSRIGSNNAGARYFDGDIDDFRIYDRALEPHEVQQLYQWGTRGQNLAYRLTKK